MTRPVDPILIDREGHSACLLGDEAIVRGALEAGVAFASGYPGTPSSEITDTFGRIADEAGVVFEYSVNEKTALEMAFAASLAGARSICAMKHLGLMVAGDPLSTIPYIGVEAGMVIVSAGDPSCRTSPNEQDQRHLGPMLHLPVLDPSTPAEARELTRLAFELSEESRLPVLLRVTTRVCHSRASVPFGPLRRPEVGGFSKAPGRYVPVPHNARRMRREIPGRLARARSLVEAAGTLRRSGQGGRAVLAAGACAATTADVLRHEGVADQLTLLRLSALYPLPEGPLVAALREVERLLVVEELSPYLEDAVLALCQRHGLRVEVLGKRSGHLPEEFEYEPEIIASGLAGAFGLRLGLALAPGEAAPGASEDVEPLPSVPSRPPSLCPGCPHRSAYLAARNAFPDDQLYFNDIGCYTLGYGEPLDTADAVLCMGAGFTLAAGVARVTGKRTVGFMGDGTFFHSGMPALLGAIKEGVGMVAVVLDNEVTAMTGFQESPARSAGHHAKIEEVARALGAAHVEVIDPHDLRAATEAFGRARDARGTSVVVVRRVCPVYEIRRGPRPGEAT